MTGRGAMRVTVLTVEDPWGEQHGGTLRTRAFAEAFASLGHDVTCVFPASRTAPALPLGGGDDGIRRVAVADTGLGGRAPGWVGAVKRRFLPMPTAAGARSASVEQALDEIGPTDLLVVVMLPYAAYADRPDVGALWLDHSDVYSDFAAREAASRRGLPRVTASWQHRAIVSTETQRSRAALVTSAAGWLDTQALQRAAGREVVWLPTPLPEVGRAPKPRDGRPLTAGFLANFRFPPNRDAAALLAERWAPRLVAAGWQVVVAGFGSEDLRLPDVVQARGAVASPIDFYDTVDATLAPIRLGGGMKVKVVESLLHGRPVVATDFAVAGFPDDIRAATYVVDVDAPVLPPTEELLGWTNADYLRALRPFTVGEFRHRVGAALGALPLTTTGTS